MIAVSQPRPYPGPARLWSRFGIEIAGNRATVGQFYSSGVAGVRPVPGLESFNDHRIALPQGAAVPAKASQSVGCAAFALPVLHRPIGPRDIQINPDVRIGPLQLCYLAAKSDGFTSIELRCKRVVGEGPDARREYCQNKIKEDSLFHQSISPIYFTTDSGVLNFESGMVTLVLISFN